MTEPKRQTKEAVASCFRVLFGNVGEWRNLHLPLNEIQDHIAALEAQAEKEGGFVLRWCCDEMYEAVTIFESLQVEETGICNTHDNMIAHDTCPHCQDPIRIEGPKEGGE